MSFSFNPGDGNEWLTYNSHIFFCFYQRIPDQNNNVLLVFLKENGSGPLSGLCWCGRLMLSALDFESNGLDSSPGWGHCVVFLSNVLYFHISSLHSGV